MRIYYSENSDPMITDSAAGLNALNLDLSRFLSSSESRLFVPADTSGSPAPYAALLSGIEFEKDCGPIRVTLEPGLGLRVRGSTENLQVWCSHFSFPVTATEGNHHHPENVDRSGYLATGTMSVIIEVRDEADSAL